MTNQLMIEKQIKRTIASVMRLHQDSLTVNSGYLFGVNVVGAFVGMAFWALAARLYSPDDVGLASAVISIVQMLAGMASFGLGMGLVRFLTGEDDPKRMLNTTASFVVLTSIVIGSVYLAGIQLWSPTLESLNQRWDLAIGFIGFLGVLVLGSLFQMVYLACREARYALWQVLTMNALRLVLIVAFMSTSALGIIAAVAIGAIFADGLSLFIFLPLVVEGFRIRPQWSANVIKRLVPYSVRSHIADLLYRAPVLLVPPLTLEMLDAESSAHAYVGWMLGWLLTSPGQALAASAFAEGSRAPHDLRQILSRAVGYALAVTTPLAFGVGLGAPWVLELFGASYSTGATALLRWLAMAAPLVALNSLYFSALRVQKRMGELVMLSVLSAAVSLAIPLFSLQQAGLAATGIGWLAAQSLVTIVAAYSFLTMRTKAKRQIESTGGLQ